MKSIASESVLDVLSDLIDKSLVVYEEQPDGTGRYRLLETVRQYARERLVESNEAEAVSGRHADWFLALAEKASLHLQGPEQAAWLARLEADHDNLRAALSWYEEKNKQQRVGAGSGQSEAAESALRLAGALGRFWEGRGHFSEGGQCLVRTLEGTERQAELTGRERNLVRAKALSGAGNLAYRQGEFDAARGLYEESLSISQRLGEQHGIANSLNNLGLVAHAQGDYGKARGLFEESLSISRHLEEQRGIANSLNNLGLVAYTQCDYQSARAWYEESLVNSRLLGDQQGIINSLINLALVACQQNDYLPAQGLYEESLTICRQLGDHYKIAFSLIGLGHLAYRQGDYGAARALFEESLALRRALGDQTGISHSLVNLGAVVQKQGDYGAAQVLYGESLTISHRSRDRQIIAFSLENLGVVAQEQNRSSRAVRLWGAASSLREAIGSPLSPAEQADADQSVNPLREALGEEAFAAAWASGHALTVEQAVEFALADED